MFHLKKDCVANNMIIANNCGLACANCMVCKCQDDTREIEKLETAEQLEQRRLLVWHESNEAQKRLYHGSTGYSYPAWQLRAIDARKKELGI